MLSSYDIELFHKRGKEMHIVDALSRAYPKNSVLKVDEQSATGDQSTHGPKQCPV